jgi:hypothetical protein
LIFSSACFSSIIPTTLQEENENIIDQIANACKTGLFKNKNQKSTVYLRQQANEENAKSLKPGSESFLPICRDRKNHLGWAFTMYK